jgi:hypothetical protein
MALERGDVVRIENLYDDGWGLGRKLKTKIWDLPEERSTERDSGIGTSHRASSSTTYRGSSEGRPETSDKGKEKEIAENGSVKAFPMVCVCHRDAWAEVPPTTLTWLIIGCCKRGGRKYKSYTRSRSPYESHENGPRRYRTQHKPQRNSFRSRRSRFQFPRIPNATLTESIK